MTTAALTQADIDAFAELTGDHHPQHVDPDWAAASPFGSTIAHGLLVLSAAAGRVEFDPEHVLALRKVTDVVFKRPVRPDEPFAVEHEIGDVRPPGLATCSLRVRGEDGRVAMTAKLEVVWR